MTDAELMAHPKIGPEIAAKYLQNGTTAQDIRVEAQHGISPYCTCDNRSGHRYRYRINPGLLIKYKHGELGL